MNKMVFIQSMLLFAALAVPAQERAGIYSWTADNGNPIVRHKFTADPATYVENDTLWIWTGEDSNKANSQFDMRRWCIFSTTDMKRFTEYPTPLKPKDFCWAEDRAYAAHMIGRNDKYYVYVSTDATGIGVAVADKPQGPYHDALGKPLVAKADCFASNHFWCCIDPAVFIDQDGQAYLFWGNRQLYYAKLRPGMTAFDGDIRQVSCKVGDTVKPFTFENTGFTEAPFIHKRGQFYYLSFAYGDPERIAYAMAKSVCGPWTFKGVISQWAGNSPSNHQAIVDFKGKSYFFYHNGSIQKGTLAVNGGGHNRSICFEELHYNADGTIKPIQMTSADVWEKFAEKRSKPSP